MLFHSALFIFMILPLFVGGWYFLGRYEDRRPRLWFVIAVSSLFCGLFGWEYLILLIGSGIFTYQIGRFAQKKAVFICGITVHLLVLFLFKSAGLLAPERFGSLAMPVGLSFYTFSQIAYLAECRKGKEGLIRTPVRLLDYLAYTAYFPKLAEGPITLPDEVLPSFSQDGKTVFRKDLFTQGVILFVLGLSKKTLLADRLAPVVDQAYAAPDAMNAAGVFLTAFLYIFQLYFDFSGYCDMASGISSMIGIPLPLNFNSPFQALSIRESWQRWHMTLTRFFTRYVYIPFGGSRRGEGRRILNTLIVFFLSGLWHGLSSGYLVWGMLHGILVSLPRRKENAQKNPLIRRIVTFLLFSFSFVFFRAEKVQTALKLLAGLKGGRGSAGLYRMADAFRINELYVLREMIYLRTPELLGRYDLILMLLFLLLCFVLTAGRNAQEIAGQMKLTRRNAILLAILFVLSLLSLGRVSTFMYFKY
ncbi:MAG: MBOAT family protein [Lachnospiraceae bacterium]|nr:MBOAT family protein [Lachnospiraceae bacterium]